MKEELFLKGVYAYKPHFQISNLSYSKRSQVILIYKTRFSSAGSRQYRHSWLILTAQQQPLVAGQNYMLFFFFTLNRIFCEGLVIFFHQKMFHLGTTRHCVKTVWWNQKPQSWLITHLHYVVLFSFHLLVFGVHPFSCRQEIKHFSCTTISPISALHTIGHKSNPILQILCLLKTILHCYL